MASHFAHQPVLLDESIRYLHLLPGAVVVDGTLGGGGHALRILGQIGEEGKLIGFDRDEEALRATRARMRDANVADARVMLVHESFRNLDSALARLQVEEVDAVLLDLGVSSPQLDRPERGFRFRDAETRPSALDMRMDPSRGETAAELLRRASAEELERWFSEYGELPGSRRLARAIAASREQAPVETSADLLRVIREAGVGRGRRHDPATLVFQALRIAVNDELSALQEGLEAAISRLRPGGRLVVIAYHSLEDRIVKQLFRREQKGCVCPPKQPVCTCEGKVTLRILTRRPVRPSDEESAHNPRARSARLRAAERVAGAAA